MHESHEKRANDHTKGHQGWDARGTDDSLFSERCTIPTHTSIHNLLDCSLYNSGRTRLHAMRSDLGPRCLQSLNRSPYGFSGRPRFPSLLPLRRRQSGTVLPLNGFCLPELQLNVGCLGVRGSRGMGLGPSTRPTNPCDTLKAGSPAPAWAAKRQAPP